MKTAVPVDGRFEHIILSCNATSDHAIICIEREAATALGVSFPLPCSGGSRHCFQIMHTLVTSFSLSLSLYLIVSEMQLMQEKDESLAVPPKQKMERQMTMEKEHREEHSAALRRAVTLAVPHAFPPSRYGTFDEGDGDDSNHSSGDSSQGSSTKTKTKESWDELIERLFERDHSGRMLLKKPLFPH